MKRLCRNCGKQVTKENYETKEAYCPYCDKTIPLLETITYYNFSARVEQLKAMHELMRNANDEEIYFAWITEMPDEPSDADIEYIALSDESYNDCFDLFVKLIKYNGNRY